MLAEKTITTTVDKLLPGISHQETLSTAPVELNTSYDNQGRRTLSVFFRRTFTKGDIQLAVLNPLVDREPPKNEEEEKAKRRGAAVIPDKEEYRDERELFEKERERIVKLPSSNVLEKTSSDLYTLDQARSDFLSGRGGREYKKIYTDSAKPAPDEVVFFMSEAAGIIKKHPELWRYRKTDTSRASDVTALSRYAQLGNEARGRVHSEFFFRLSEEAQKDTIDRHMKLIMGANQLVSGGEIVGYFRRQNRVVERIDGGWSIMPTGEPVKILENDKGFSIEAMTPDVLMAAFSWNSNGIRNLGEFEIEEGKQLPVESGNPKVDLVYKVSPQNISMLLSVMVLERIYNIRNRLKGKYMDPSRVMEDCFARRNSILNASELVRNAEELLTA